MASRHTENMASEKMSPLSTEKGRVPLKAMNCQPDQRPMESSGSIGQRLRHRSALEMRGWVGAISYPPR